MNLSRWTILLCSSTLVKQNYTKLLFICKQELIKVSTKYVCVGGRGGGKNRDPLEYWDTFQQLLLVNC